MKIRELTLDDLSRLRSRAFTCEFGGEHNPIALVLEYSGKYGVGSQGNDDASYMIAIKSAWLAVHNFNAIVFDLRQLEYKWGDAIWKLFQWGWSDGGPDSHVNGPRSVFPTALVISDQCREGFSTCQGLVPPMFDDFDEALRFVETPSRKYLDDLFTWLDFGSLDPNSQSSE